MPIRHLALDPHHPNVAARAKTSEGYTLLQLHCASVVAQCGQRAAIQWRRDFNF
jgi:hypothetical protein